MHALCVVCVRVLWVCTNMYICVVCTCVCVHVVCLFVCVFCKCVCVHAYVCVCVHKIFPVTTTILLKCINA